MNGADVCHPFVQKWNSVDAHILEEGRWDSPAAILSLALGYRYPGEKNVNVM